MKYTGYLAVLLLLAAACRSVPKGDASLVTEAQPLPATPAGIVYHADPAGTRIEWTGTSPVARHHGTFAVREGILRVQEGSITGGRFVIDMASLQADDADSINNARLGNHLKSNDFFDVSQYPEAGFEITGVQPLAGKGRGLSGDATHTVTGNLLLKEISKSISFPARIEEKAGRLTADARFNMDRGLWDISYGNDRSLKNKAIRPMVNIRLHLEAKR